MKYFFLLTLTVIFFFPASAQKSRLKVKKLRATLSVSAELGAGLKMVGMKATETEEDDCTPPPCTGIIDPWTCECYSDIRDPWKEKKIASKMKAIQEFETRLKRGEGKNIFPSRSVMAAQKKYPGNSLKALVNRMNYYNSIL